MGTFTRTFVPALGREVHRLGLACNYGIDGAALEAGLERGLQYVFWTQLRTGKVKPAVKRALAKRREDVVLASGATLALFGGSVRRAAERTCKDLGTD